MLQDMKHKSIIVAKSQHVSQIRNRLAICIDEGPNTCIYLLFRKMITTYDEICQEKISENSCNLQTPSSNNELINCMKEHLVMSKEINKNIDYNNNSFRVFPCFHC